MSNTLFVEIGLSELRIGPCSLETDGAFDCASKYADLIVVYLVDIKEAGSFWLDQSYFNYCSGLTMTSRKFHDLFGGEPRKPESILTQREKDSVTSVQAVIEEVVCASLSISTRKPARRTSV